MLTRRAPSYSIHSYMYNTNGIAADFKQKIPDIEETLAVVKKLKTKRDDQEALVTRYSLADAVYAKAEIDTVSGLVGLWLGANVMLEYTYEDAIELLVSKEEKAKKEFEEVSSLFAVAELPLMLPH